jgi:hypothetical protein
MNCLREFIKTEMVILTPEEGGRSTPLLSVGYGGRYRPHIVLQSRNTRQARTELRDEITHIIDEYLGVALWDGPAPIPIGQGFIAIMILIYPDHVAYDQVLPSAEFTMREGGKIIGHGRVLERWSEETLNKAVDSTATSVMPPASSLRSGQEPRHGQP